MRERLAQGITRLGRWSIRSDLLPLAAGERVVIESLATHMQGPWLRQGWLRITNMRLIYMPAKAPYVPKLLSRLPVVEIELGEVVALGERHWLRRLWGGFPGVAPFVVELRDGTSYTFQTLFPGMWRREIAKAAGLDADA